MEVVCVVAKPPSHLLILCAFHYCLFCLFSAVSTFYCSVMAIINSNMDSKAIIYVTDIDENSRDVWFEGKILNRYCIFDFVHSGYSKRASGSSILPYMNCDFINRECLTIVTMTIVGDVIHHHEVKITLGTYVRVESFGVKKKHVGGSQKNRYALCNHSIAKYTSCRSSSF